MDASPRATRSADFVGSQEPLPIEPSDGYVAADFARRVATSLSPPNADSLTRAFAGCAREPASFEASVRGSASTSLKAGRMMVEQASPDALTEIARALGVVLPPAAALWVELAQGESVPIIVGWDLRSGGNDRCVKLYVNASNAWHASGARISAVLTPGMAASPKSPAIVGMNVRADGIVEIKLYVQAADAVNLASRLGPRAQALAASARNEGADAGGVVSFDVSGGSLRARAFFVALREPPDLNGWRCVRALPGYNPRSVAGLLPFTPAPPRSVGISLNDETWTLYCKPQDSGRAPEAIEPVAIFRNGDAEVGVFVEPTEHATRAFLRTERYAVIVRVRHGVPDPLAIESLVNWFAARLRQSERDGMHGDTCLLDPPAPWYVVDLVDSRRRSGERL